MWELTLHVHLQHCETNIDIQAKAAQCCDYWVPFSASSTDFSCIPNTHMSQLQSIPQSQSCRSRGKDGHQGPVTCNTQSHCVATHVSTIWSVCQIKEQQKRSLTV